MPPKTKKVKKSKSKDNNSTKPLAVSAFAEDPGMVYNDGTNSTGDFGLGARYNINTNDEYGGLGDLNGALEYKDDFGNLFGVRGGAQFDNEKLMKNPYLSAFADVKLGDKLNVEGSIDKDKYWQAAARLKLSDKLDLGVNTDKFKNHGINANFRPNDKLELEGSAGKDMLRASARWNAMKNLDISADIGKYGDQTKANLGLKYRF